MLNHSGTRAAGNFTFTEFVSKNFKDRIRFLFTGKITTIERGLTSDLNIQVGDLDEIMAKNHALLSSSISS